MADTRSDLHPASSLGVHHPAPVGQRVRAVAEVPRQAVQDQRRRVPILQPQLLDLDHFNYLNRGPIWFHVNVLMHGIVGVFSKI